MPAPDFFLAGAPKAGTTALYTYLGRHPEVGLSEPKEPHFFDVHFDKGVDWYTSSCFPAGGAAVGEATPHYLFLPYAMERIARLFGDARIIVLLRDPVERAFSDWWMYWTRATEPLPFREAVRENLERIERGPSFVGPRSEELWQIYFRETMSGYEGRITRRPYVELGYYASQLQRVREYFPEENLLVLFSEDLASRPREVIRRVWRFLGLEETADLAEELPRVNRAPGGIVRVIYRLARDTVLEPLIRRLPRSVRTGVKRLTANLSPRPQIPVDVRDELTDHYRTEIQALENLLDRKLDSWRR